MFRTVTTLQILWAYAVLALVLEAARTHADNDVVYGTVTYRWGTGAPMVASISPGPSRRLLWGDVLDTIIAVQNFLATIPCTHWVQINENNEAKSHLGVFYLEASMSTVSSS